MAQSNAVRVCWDWQEWLQESYFTLEEQYLFCVAEANEKYRYGESVIKDSEYDYFVDIANAHEITSNIGTGLTCGLVLFYLGHTEEHTYMSQASRRSSVKVPTPTAPSRFDGLLNSYKTYQDNNPDSDIIPYNALAVKQTRAWDSDAKQMDYGVKVVDGKILVPATAEDDTFNWTTEETALIAGKYYYAMQLDAFFVLMDDASITDQDGDLLYEGDIVVDIASQAYVVVFDRYRRRWVLSTTHALEWNPYTLSIGIHYAVVSKRVGNIYQNPEYIPQRTQE